MSRIADVGNPWLDAGIVSFSTLRYRRDREFWRKWYPATWISESFPGQFRNWFYSLLAMATVIDHSPPFLENFGYSTLLAEDGRPMHKSWGNSIEFNDAADKMGVDVMRWLYLAHKPENNLLFGYHRADEARRQFLLPLWNVYNFFITYAILDGWEPPGGAFAPLAPEGPTPSSDNPLDRWVLARLNQVVERCTEVLQTYDAYSATMAVETFLDDLTNWYVRRSRRRFWKSEQDADKQTAYATLYHVLVKLAKLLAPFTPFVTEVMYQNLVRATTAGGPAAYGSIHHCDWPLVDQRAIDQELLEQMDLARRIASLGLGARGSANIKVRQPLAKAMAYVGGGKAELRPELVEIVADELNVKSFEFVAEEGVLVNYRLLPDNKTLGPRFGPKFPMLRAALAAADAGKVARRVQAGLPVTLQVDGESVELAPEEVLVQTQPGEGLAVATERGVTVAVDAVITPELRAEGLAREVVRRVQTMRKEAGFNIEDRITTWYLAENEMGDVMRAWGDYIRAETLSNELVAQAPPPDAYSENHTVDGASITLGVKRNA
jgi:isoleucyl-tRNA synthetase